MTHSRVSLANLWAAPATAVAALLLISALQVDSLAAPPPRQNPAPETSSASAPARKPDAKKAKQAYQEGLKAERSADWESAFAAYSEAVAWAPDNRDDLLRRELARSRVVQSKVNTAERDAVDGKLADARKELVTASYLDPTNTVIRDRLNELAVAQFGQPAPVHGDFEPAGQVALDYSPGKKSFDYHGDTQGAYQEVARQFGVEVAFDVDLVSRPARFRVDDVDFLTAMRILGDMTGTFWRPLASHLFFVTANTQQKRKDYDVSIVRTIQLPASETTEQMTETFRLVRDITGITRSQLDTNSRTLTLRASPQAVAVATGLVEDLEKPVGQLVLEIEVLDINRAYAQQLGITPPQTSTIYTLSSQQVTEAQQSLQGLISVATQVFGLPSSLTGLSSTQISSLLSAGQLNASTLVPPLVAFGGGNSTFLATLPGATANFSQMLSLVQSGRRILLRAEDNQPATFFVGDRIPISLATFSSSLSSAANISGISADDFPTTEYATGNGPTFVTAPTLGNSSQDLVVANFTDNTISVFLNNGDGTYGAQTSFPTGTGPTWIATGIFNTVNSNQNVDLAVANQNANTVSILLGNGDGTFQAKTDLTAGSEPVSVVTANFHDASGTTNLDLAVANHGDSTIDLYQGNGDGTFQKPTQIQLPTGYAPSALAAMDFNGDGHIDLAIADEDNASVSIFLGNGDGTFKARTDYPTGMSPVWVTTGDFNGDGITDLAIANKSDNTVSILLGIAAANSTTIGSGTFGAQTAFTAGNGPTSIAVGDFNVDGEPDLAVSDETDNAISILLGTGSGSFDPNFEIPVGTSPAAIVTGDFNADGKADVAVANNGSNNITVILNSSTFEGSNTSSPGTLFPGVQYLDVGLKVKATPRIHPDNEVTLQLQFEISSVASESINSIPIINNETIDQTVRVKENETATLAGILQGQISNSVDGTPGIGELPGIGYLAGNQNLQNSSQELLILVTPRMVKLSPRKDHVIYAGQGSLDNAGTGVDVTRGPIRQAPPENGAPAPPAQVPPQQPAAPPQAPPGNPGQAQPPQAPPTGQQPAPPQPNQ